MRMLPSPCWWFSASAMMVRPTPTAVPFRVCRCSGPFPSSGRERTPRRRGRELGVFEQGGKFPEPFLARQPRLDVVLLGRRAPEVVQGDVHHPVGDLQGLEQLLLDLEETLV